MLDPAVFKSLYCNITLYETDTSLRQITDTQEVLFNFKTENTENNMTASYDLGIRSKLLFNIQIVNATKFFKRKKDYSILPWVPKVIFLFGGEKLCGKATGTRHKASRGKNNLTHLSSPILDFRDIYIFQWASGARITAYC